MSSLDQAILAERAAAVERHINRLKSRLPKDLKDFKPNTDASDTVILHLWQAIQIIIDTALSACVHFRLGTPVSYAEAFLKLSESGYLEKELGIRLVHAAGFRNRIVHAYEELDMHKVYKIAAEGPPDLNAFLASINKRL